MNVFLHTLQSLTSLDPHTNSQFCEEQNNYPERAEGQIKLLKQNLSPGLLGPSTSLFSSSTFYPHACWSASSSSVGPKPRFSGFIPAGSLHISSVTTRVDATFPRLHTFPPLSRCSCYSFFPEFSLLHCRSQIPLVRNEVSP